MIVTGTGGGVTHSVTFTLNVSDFSLSVYPGAVTASTGSSGAVTVGVNGTGGFSGAVSLSASGLPSGVTAAFSPPYVSGSGSSVLTFGVGVGVAAGTYPVTLIGTAGSLTRTTLVSLTVANFSLSASPTTLTIPVGGSATSTISVVGGSGFNGSVSLSATGLPSGVTAAFNPSSVGGGSSSTLTLSASATAPAGVWPITVRGTYNGATLTTPLTLTITDFSLSVTPSTLSIAPGSNKTAIVSMVPLSGFTGSAALSISGMPAGMTAIFSSPSVNAGNSSTLTITLASTIVQSTYTLTISGIAAGITRTTALTVMASDPQVTVTMGSLQDVYVTIPATTTATASVNPLPGGYSSSDLIATWSYSTAYIEFSATGTDDLWSDPGDGSTAVVTLNGAATDPTGTFTGTFNTLGYYEACIGATVSFYNPTTRQTFGPYTGYGFASNDGYAGSSAVSRLVGKHPISSPSGAPPIIRQPKIKTSPLSGYVAGAISIDGQLDPNSPGGSVVLNQDGNGALRQRITISYTGPPSWGTYSNNSIKLLRNNSKIDIYTSADGGFPMVFNGVSNVIPASHLPVTLYVGGTSYSTTMRDAILSAQAITAGKGSRNWNCFFYFSLG